MSFGIGKIHTVSSNRAFTDFRPIEEFFYGVDRAKKEAKKDSLKIRCSFMKRTSFRREDSSTDLGRLIPWKADSRPTRSMRKGHHEETELRMSNNLTSAPQ